jgi:energy-coupling factor transporter ATP-binding protein EcfA2
MTSNGDPSPPTGSEGIDTEPASEGGTTEAPRARLTRLKINRFRHVKPGTELRFDDGINVLLGRNGTGKTTLLELVCGLASGDLRMYQNEEIELEFEMQLSGDRMLVAVKNSLVPRQRHPLGLPIDADTHDHAWLYRLTFARSDGSNYLIEAEEGRTVLHHGSEPPTSLPAAPLFVAGFHEKSIRLALNVELLEFPTHRVLQRLLANNCVRLDEGLDLFRATVIGLALPRIGRPFTATLFSGFPWGNPPSSVQIFLELHSTYFPASLLECLLEAGEAAHRDVSINVSGSRWPVLGELERILGFEKILVTFQLIEREELKGGVQSSYGSPVFQVTTHRGTTFTHDKLSYGEKRLLAFMYHAAANPQILVADELVNGLHHGWIQACLDAIQGQAFLTSQNPLLLDHLPFSSAEEVRRRFILCDRDEHGDWIWRNMDEDAAGAFYRAYKVGIQHVSEILETKGLW